MREWKYTVLFPAKPPYPTKKTEVDELLELLAATPGSAGDLPAGYTYLGQFTVHDLTSLRQNERPPRFKQNGTLRLVNAKGLTSRNKPALDLDSIYRGGLSDPIIPFDSATGAFLLGMAGSAKDLAGSAKGNDLPRDESLQPLIGDPRNDENLLIAQMQVLFMRFHNRVIKDLRVSGMRDPDDLFQRAREEVTKVYQYLVLHDFLRELVPEAVYEAIVLQGRGRLSTPSQLDPRMALEFADAACRLHSLVRVSYDLRDRRSISLEGMRELTGFRKGPQSTKPLLQKNDVVDWRHFFEFSNYPKQTKHWQHANAISFVTNPVLRELERLHRTKIDMLKTNVLRGPSHGLGTGQQACRMLQGRFPDLAAELELRCIDGNDFVLGQLKKKNSLRTRTPLWPYLMLEANPGKLGVLGGWIVADTLRTAALNSAIRLSDLSDTQATELYEPLKDVAQDRSGRAITIEDVIMYTYNYRPNREGKHK